jgi:apolipoprotein D and lipocalin family protein
MKSINLPRLLATAAISLGALQAPAASGATTPVPIAALASLNIPAYMGTWYQVAWFPNRFQKQCVSDTAASYRRLPAGEGVEVINRCRLEDGSLDSVVGLARPAGSAIRGDQLEPAQLEVSFLPRLLRWIPAWGAYWVLQMADDGRYAVIGEPSRQYLWVLSRTPQLAPADETAIRSQLTQQGYDLARWQAHPHTPTAEAPR